MYCVSFGLAFRRFRECALAKKKTADTKKNKASGIDAAVLAGAENKANAFRVQVKNMKMLPVTKSRDLKMFQYIYGIAPKLEKCRQSLANPCIQTER